MQEVVVPQRFAAPQTRATPGGSPDDSSAIFDLLQHGIERALGTALITVVEVEGGSARGPGAQMAVLSDGRYCGYISGGCLEAVIAAEALKCMAQQRDTVLRFGVGSPFVDVRLPCGGSIELHVHVGSDAELIAEARMHLARREAFAIELTPARAGIELAYPIGRDRRTGWHEETFRRCYPPTTRLVLIGRGLELEQTARIAAAAGTEVLAFCADDASLQTALSCGAGAARLSTPDEVPQLPIDAWTAVILLFHDHDWELAFIRDALQARPFYIGAMGSLRAHETRCRRLLAEGVAEADIARVKGPVGLFGPTRDATSLAISILADVTERRLQLDGQ
jgi:xanthine dehydrogenase accessory factor